MTTLANKIETKARKEHRCDFCMDKIRVKETYLKTTFIFEGDICNWKTHKHCEKLAIRLNMYEDAYEGVDCDDFAEHVQCKYIELLSSQIPEKHRRDCDDIIHQLGYVPIRDKMWFVIRHFNKLDKESSVLSKESLNKESH